MSASGWLAIGAVLAALVAPGVGSPIVATTAGVTALGAGGASHIDRGRAGRGRTTYRPALATAIGALAIGLRLLTSPVDVGASDPARSLPDGRGPWSAVVEARGSDRDGQQLATVRIAADEGAGEGAGSARSWLVVATLPRYPEIEPGLTVTIDGALEAPPLGPYGDYLRRIDVVATIRSRTLKVDGSVSGPGAALERLRRGAGDALAAAIPEPEAGLAAGIVIGLRDRVDRSLAADFTTVGASHVVAISGWNIAIVAATVAALTRGLGGRRRRSLTLAVAIVVYTLFAGASPSVVRAAAMAGVVLLARETGRAGRATAALGWAAAILLVVEPTLVLDAGFQLSTLATAGILAWADRLDRRLRTVAGGRLPGWLAESLSVSLAAQAATLPIVLATFGRLAIISPVINLAVVPLVAPAMAAALIALLGGAVAVLGGPAVVATVAGLPAWALLTAMCTVIRAGAALPIASVALGPPWTIVSAIAVAVVPAAVVVGRRRWPAPPRRDAPRSANAITPPAPVARVPDRRRRASARYAAIALAVAVGALGMAATHRVDGTTRITVLDVGQGDSILVEGGRGARMLIDGGPDPDRLLVELDRRLPPWDRRIDILVLTHPHEDHVAGLALLLERYRIGRTYETGMRGPGPGYGAFAHDLAGPSAPPDGILSTGARIALDDIRFRVLWPDPGRVPREPPDGGRGINDVSIVLLGEVAGRRFLLTGDVEDDVDPILTQRGLPPIDVLKVAHHGSATASTPAFLDAVTPRVAIVSAGAGNPYGHPARSTIDRLAATGARVLRTDRDGSVAVSIGVDGTIAVATSGARNAASAPVTKESRVAATSTAIPRPAVPAISFSCGIPSSG